MTANEHIDAVAIWLKVAKDLVARSQDHRNDTDPLASYRAISDAISAGYLSPGSVDWQTMATELAERLEAALDENK